MSAAARILTTLFLLRLIGAPARVAAQALRPRTMEAYRLPAGVEIQVDGRLDEEVWKIAPSYADWVQKEPDEGSPALNDTRVWLLYDAQSLYVGVINYDQDPASIARNMARRDAVYSGRSDYFEVMIDPNGDQLTAYRFRVTAGGVQTDRYLYADDKEDAAWDAVYESPVTRGRAWLDRRVPHPPLPDPLRDGRHRADLGNPVRPPAGGGQRAHPLQLRVQAPPGAGESVRPGDGLVLDERRGRFEALPVRGVAGPYRARPPPAIPSSTAATPRRGWAWT